MKRLFLAVLILVITQVAAPRGASEPPSTAPALLGAPHVVSHADTARPRVVSRASHGLASSLGASRSRSAGEGLPGRVPAMRRLPRVSSALLDKKKGDRWGINPSVSSSLKKDSRRYLGWSGSRRVLGWLRFFLDVRNVYPSVETVKAVARSGTATWYCGHGSACTHGYSGNDMVAAIDPSLGIKRGTLVTVSHGGREVLVRIVDVCACSGRRLIDLTSGAFARLAPLSAGVIRIELEVGAVAPPTDMEGLP